MRRSRRDRRRLPATAARRISPASTTGCGSHAPPPPLALPPRAPSSRSPARLRGRAPRTHPQHVYEHCVHRDEFVAAADDLAASDCEGHVSSLCRRGLRGARADVVVAGDRARQVRLLEPVDLVGAKKEPLGPSASFMCSIYHRPTPSSVEAIAQLRERLSDQRTPVIPPLLPNGADLSEPRGVVCSTDANVTGANSPRSNRTQEVGSSTLPSSIEKPAGKSGFLDFVARCTR